MKNEIKIPFFLTFSKNTMACIVHQNLRAPRREWIWSNALVDQYPKLSISMKTLKKSVAAGLATLFAWTLAGIASAQTTTSDFITSTSSATSGGAVTPGIPNTGGGDVVTNVFLLATSAAVALIGLAYLSRKWARS
jgi:hypothetical protein